MKSIANLVIRITRVTAHPQFGGEEIKTWDYPLSDGAFAEGRYAGIKEDDCDFQHTTIQIVEVEND